VSNFSLAVNRFYTGSDGEKKQDTCFVRIVTWGKQAEACSRYLSKGKPVFVEGRLSSRSWTGADGEKRSRIEVVADRVQFLERFQGKGSVETETGAPDSQTKDVQVETQDGAKEDDVPF